MNGAQLTKKVIERIERVGGKAINLIAASKSGNADVIACINGRYCEFEIKGKGDRKRPDQALKLNQAIASGGIGAFITDVKELNYYIRLAKTGEECPPVLVEVKKFEL